MPVEREAVVSAGAADAAWVARIDDQLRSLKSMVAVLALLAVAALAVAIYVLVTDDSRDDQGASRERVARLDDRVDRLERDAASASEESDVSRLQARLQGKADNSDLQQLDDEVAKLRTAVQKAGSGDTTVAQDISQLSGRVDQLESDVEQLRSQP